MIITAGVYVLLCVSVNGEAFLPEALYEIAFMTPISDRRAMLFPCHCLCCWSSALLSRGVSKHTHTKTIIKCLVCTRQRKRSSCLPKTQLKNATKRWKLRCLCPENTRKSRQNKKPTTTHNVHEIYDTYAVHITEYQVCA